MTLVASTTRYVFEPGTARLRDRRTGLVVGPRRQWV